MRYRVRTPDGELDYTSIGEVEAAYVQGLVGPDDELLEEGHTVWRKASSFPILARARPKTRAPGRTAQVISVLLAVAMGMGALMLLPNESLPRKGLGLFLALGAAMLLSRVTYTAFKRPGAPRA